jgi:hypothetical protein
VVFFSPPAAEISVDLSMLTVGTTGESGSRLSIEQK